MHIAIAGNIGSGKTTLTNLLSEHFGWVPRYESVDQNPYISDYYSDISRWAFNMEVFFLKERFKDVLNIVESQKSDKSLTIIQDRTIYEGVHVFTRNNFLSGNLDERDYRCYMDLFDQMQEQLQLPDLMIYLRADISHLINNISKRGREYEQSMSIDYLDSLNKLYEDFILNQYKGDVLIIDKAKYDLKNPVDLGRIYDAIDTRLNGLFKL